MQRTVPLKSMQGPKQTIYFALRLAPSTEGTQSNLHRACRNSRGPGQELGAAFARQAAAIVGRGCALLDASHSQAG